MAIEVKELVEKAVHEIAGNTALQQQFKKEPAKALEKVLGVDLPDDVIRQVVKAVEGKLSLDKLADAAEKLDTEKLGSAVDALKKLF